VKDDGNYDWDTTDGHITDPYAIGAPDGGTGGGSNPGSGSGGGGCDAGSGVFGIFGLAGLMIFALGRAPAKRRR
jgi:hypothetical protein